MTSDPSAMRLYTQRFTYDVVGNILKMQHISGTGWTRHYQYAPNGNRLLATSAPGDNANGPYSHTYDYDAHGSMTIMPHLAAMDWNHDYQLVHATAGTEQVYFQYAGGVRSRKFTEKSGSTTEERIYLGPFEIYRKRINGNLDLERESLHVSDGTGQICIIETKTVADETPVQNPTPMWRYQLSNHLGSAATEVTQDGSIISYEEYHPYGTSAYRAVDASIDVSAKRYRYTGMERDEETGLSYHSARYYVLWLGRWLSTDPAGMSDGANRYEYVAGNPVSYADFDGRKKQGSITGAIKRLAGLPDGVGGSQETEIVVESGDYTVDDTVAFLAEQPDAWSSFVASSHYSAEHKDAVTRKIAQDAQHPVGAAIANYQDTNNWTLASPNAQAEASMGQGPVRGQAMTEAVGGLTGFGAELSKTVLQELFRLRTSYAGASDSLTQAAATAETEAAASFAERAFNAFFRS